MPYRNKEDEKKYNKGWKNRKKGNPAYVERCRKECKKYSSTPEAKQKRKEYRSRPEVKAREAELRRNNYLTIKGRHVRVKKRQRPWDDACEICKRVSKKLSWHHWDDNRPERGIWVCFLCHSMAECIDRDLHGVYILMKEICNKVG